MGNCLVCVHVTGAHHNGRQHDIDQLAGQFIDGLISVGHNVTAATIVSGGEHNLLISQGRFPVAAASVEISDNGFPRRNRLDLHTPAEKAIRDAMIAVEAVGGHRLLTHAVNLLSAAQECVADYVELPKV